VHPDGQQFEVSAAVSRDHDDLAVEHHITHRGESVELVQPVHPLATARDHNRTRDDLIVERQ
jgi:hypothetical protein